MNKIFSSLLIIFITQSLFAAYITNDIVDGCNVSNLHTYNNTTNMIPVFTPTVYNCSSGQFVPANTDGCRSCPSGYTCSGGEMTFSETKLSGINYKPTISQSTQWGCATNFLHTDNNNTTNMIPVFQPMEINCHPGYYLTANNIECSPCLIDNKCPGGTYTFNETNDQGIEPCPSNAPHAPAGSSVCYPHILHLSNEIPNDIIYLKSTKTTTPALNVDMNNDGVADVFANMTTTRATMTSASEHYLKILVEGVEYYVCDDSSCPSAE